LGVGLLGEKLSLSGLDGVVSGIDVVLVGMVGSRAGRWSWRDWSICPLIMGVDWGGYKQSEVGVRLRKLVI
jgi:hypothetical protein